MKLKATTIESVKVARQRQNDDGTWSPVYRIKLVSGDDEILAESYRTKDGLTKAGIIEGAVGTAHVEFKAKEGTSEKTGKDYCFQSITLRDFILANRNISTESAQMAAGGATDRPKEEKPAEADSEPKAEEAKETSDDVTF